MLNYKNVSFGISSLEGKYWDFQTTKNITKSMGVAALGVNSDFGKRVHSGEVIFSDKYCSSGFKILNFYGGFATLETRFPAFADYKSDDTALPLQMAKSGEFSIDIEKEMFRA